MPTLRVPCTALPCRGSFEDTVAWPGTISMVKVPRRVEPACKACGQDLSAAWSARILEVAW
jgi:hypothetical protein